MTILEALVWNPDVPKPPGTAPRERERAPSIRSSSSTWSLFNGAEDEIDPSELAAIRAFEKLRKLKTPQQKLLEQCKKKAEKDHLSGILSSTGKLQTKALNKQRRVRKDFRVTNDTSDIPGASSAKLCGHTSSGFFVDEARRDWPYNSVEFAHATSAAARALFEQPPPPPPPPPPAFEDTPEYANLVAHLKSVGFSANERRRILRRSKSTGELDHLLPAPAAPAKSVGKCSFEERVWRQHSVETHLSIPGIDLRVSRRELEPIIVPPPRPLPAAGSGIPLTVPANSIHFQPELRAFQPSNTSLAPPYWSTNDPRDRKPQRPPVQKAPAKFPKPSLDPPRTAKSFGGAPRDRSLSTHDIAGAKPRQLVSEVSRAELWRLHARDTSSFFNGL